METINEKRFYITPDIEWVELDKEISLVLQSEEDIDPDKPPVNP